MEIKLAEVLAQAIAFIVVFVILKWKAFGPIQSALKARRDKIQGDFDAIEKAREEIAQLKAEYSEHLQKIEDEARAKLNEAVDEGRQIAKDLQEKARADAQESFEKAKENLSLDVAKARIELRREIADLAIVVSEKILKEKMTGEKQEEKVMAMIEELDKTL